MSQDHMVLSTRLAVNQYIITCRMCRALFPFCSLL